MLQMRDLETERLILRQFCPNDLEDICTWEKDSIEPDKVELKP